MPNAFDKYHLKILHKINFSAKIQTDIITSFIILDEGYYNFFEACNTSKPVAYTTNYISSLDANNFLIGFNSGIIVNVDLL